MIGTIFNIKRFAVHDGPGIRTTVFLKGCPLKCVWCHNPESRNEAILMVPKKTILDGITFCGTEQIGKNVSVGYLIKEIEKERIVMEESGGGVTFSGGEPLFQPEFLTLALRACKSAGFHTAVDTSGYASREVFEQILPYSDLFLYDLKLMDDDLHRQFTGVSNSIILENLIWLAGKDVQLIVRIPLVNHITATDENINRIAGFLDHIKDRISRIDLLPYHKLGQSKYQKLDMPYEMNGNNHTPDKNRMQSIIGLFENMGCNVHTG